MALVLFEPFIIRRLKDLGYVHTVRSAKKMIERQTPEVWDILDEVTRGHPVLLNRAPTLHRLSIQAFEPQLIEGEAIRIHPLVCTAYNADFDGDQMAVHVPLSVEAQLEARMLMLAPNNIFSPSSGKPITTPSQDITLGCYYITQNPRTPKKDGRHLPLFADASEVEFAMVEGTIKTHDRILFKNPDRGRQTNLGNPDATVIETTAGRVIFNQIWPKELGFFNKAAGKKQLSDIIWRCYQIAGPAVTVETLDKLKELGFTEATRAGISIGIEDMIIPKRKESEVENAYKQVKQVDQQYRRGIITDGERYNKIIDIWTHAGDQISNVMFREIEENQDRKEFNPIHLMVDSGARGNRQQVRQLAGMRGLMAKPSGEIIERPITSNFREGLTVLEYFISTHGARKGLADTALKTADSGYLTRKLVDAAQDVIIVKDDCGTVNGIVVRSIYEGDEEVVDLGQRIIGRVSCETIADPVEKKKKIVKANQYVDEKIAADLQRIGVEQLKIRSVLTCECGRGVCAKCYGRNLATGDFVKLGEAVGIIAAQSIGEPGTQLTMRTFHIGGTASQTFKQPIIKAKNDGTVQFNDLRTVQALDGSWIVLNKNGSIGVHNEEGRELERYNVVVGSVISKEDGASVKKGETFVQWDPYNVPILTDKGGKIEFRDMIAGVTIKREVDEATGLMGTMVIEHKEDLHPQVVIVGDKKDVLASYSIPAGAHVIVEEGQKVRAGALLAKTPRKVAKTKDITGGLPRVAELFEARRPKDAAEIAKIDGIVEFGGTVRGKRSLVLKDPDTGAEEEHLIPLTKHIIVFKGDYVKKGQQLTEGPVVPHEILEVCGPQELQEHLVNEVQEVYRLQGVEINDKHIEIIVRQMLRKVKITDPGDTSLLWGDQVDKLDFEEENKKVVEKGGKPAEAVPVLLGITKASLETDSFISAASFQDTTRVLTEAATLGKIDRLRGFKENVIMGHLIPAGTGFPEHRQLKLVEKGEPVGAPVMEEAEPQPAVG
jgi:DNA-directed RNA polymerase subunit beta'